MMSGERSAYFLASSSILHLESNLAVHRFSRFSRGRAGGRTAGRTHGRLPRYSDGTRTVVDPPTNPKSVSLNSTVP